MANALDYRLIETLAAIVDSGGFERAAKRLFVTQSAVSQRLGALEEQLGHPLVERTNPPRATPVGQRVLRHFRQVSALEADLIEGLGGEAQEGFNTLRVAVNADSLGFWFMDAVTSLLESQPLLLDVVVSDQEHTVDSLRRGEVIGAVTSVDAPIAGCTSIPLGSMVYRLRSTPEFRDRWFPNGFRKAAARRAPTLTFNRDDRLQARALESVGLGPGEYPTHFVPDIRMFFEMCRRGFGYAMIPDLQVHQRGAEDELVDLSPRRAADVPLFFQHWNVETRVVRELVEAIASAPGLR